MSSKESWPSTRPQDKNTKTETSAIIFIFPLKSIPTLEINNCWITLVANSTREHGRIQNFHTDSSKYGCKRSYPRNLIEMSKLCCVGWRTQVNSENQIAFLESIIFIIISFFHSTFIAACLYICESCCIISLCVLFGFCFLTADKFWEMNCEKADTFLGVPSFVKLGSNSKSLPHLPQKFRSVFIDLECLP